MKKELGLLCICVSIITYVIFFSPPTLKTYADRTGALFEIKYPSTIVPTSEHAGDFYTVNFEPDIVVTSSPKIENLPTDPGDEITDHIVIDGYEATLFKTRFSDGQLSPGYKVVFQTDARLYRLFILKPDHAKRYLESFKVILGRATIAR